MREIELSSVQFVLEMNQSSPTIHWKRRIIMDIYMFYFEKKKRK
jgi:hypothetical protein